MFRVSAMMILLAQDLADAQRLNHDDTIPEILATYGIGCEEHTVTTDDGYVLGVFRMPRPDAPVVFLQHGLLDSSWSWLYNSPELSLSIRLYDLGYDVWMGNNRGNMFSRQHVDPKLRPDKNKEFWQFSFSDMGRHDLPAQLNHVLSQTSQETLGYVGHSQGTSQFFAAMANPNMTSFLESKVNAFVALAPVAFMKHQSVELYRVMGDFHMMDALDDVYPYGFLAFDDCSAFGELACTLTGGKLCKFGVDIACGTTDQDSTEAILNITAQFPAGTSVQAIDHYEQLFDNGNFQDYDWGKMGNMAKYGTASPPQFNMALAAKVPTALFIGSKDELGDPTDIATLTEELQSDVIVYSRTFDDFSHITWLAGTADAFEEWYPDVKMLLQKYNPLSTTSHSTPTEV